jgi:hypothetical protein
MGRDAVRWLTLAGATIASLHAVAQETPPPAAKNWSNETELSVVITEGNSSTQTFGFKDVLARRFHNKSRAQLKLEALRTADADDWFTQVDPGFTWEPGATPPTSFTSSLVKPSIEPDAENYFIEGRYDGTVRKELTWNAGASWDSNEDAGIESRYIVFAGLGHLWWDEPGHKFLTSYGLSGTHRREETPDPEKDEDFAGVRLSLEYRTKFWTNCTFTDETTTNMSLADTNDWSADMTNGLAVAMNKWLSLRVSLRWLYNHEPALEDVDEVARIAVRDPDGIPGNGDEFFETVSSGGAEVTFGETQVRKEKLDQIFKTTLVVSF